MTITIQLATFHFILRHYFVSVLYGEGISLVSLTLDARTCTLIVPPLVMSYTLVNDI